MRKDDWFVLGWLLGSTDKEDAKESGLSVLGTAFLIAGLMAIAKLVDELLSVPFLGPIVKVILYPMFPDALWEIQADLSVAILCGINFIVCGIIYWSTRGSRFRGLLLFLLASNGVRTLWNALEHFTDL